MRYQKSLRLVVALAVLSSCVLARQKPAPERAPDLKRLREHVEVLASDEFEGRKTGSEGAEQAAIYIAKQFHGYGLDCPAPNWMCHHTSNNHLGYMKAVPIRRVRRAGQGERAHTSGMKLEGVREGSPAAAAGLKAGDVIVRLAGRDVRNVYDYTQALSEMKAGQEYEVEVTRGAERLKLKITPAVRK